MSFTVPATTSKTGGSDGCSSDSNTTLIVLLGFTVGVLVVLGIIVAILWRELRRSVWCHLYRLPFSKVPFLLGIRILYLVCH